MEDLGKITGYSGIHLTPKQDMTIGRTLVKGGQTVNLSLDSNGSITKVELI